MFSSNLWGQTSYSLHLFEADSTQTNVGIYGELQYNSTNITNKFVKTFYQGGYLTKEIKLNTANRLASVNKSGLDINYGIYASINTKFSKKKNLNLHWFIGLYDRQHANISFSHNLFQAVFNGNKQFAGKNIDLSGGNLFYYHYQQAQFGLFFDNKKGAKFAGSASFLNGNNYTAFTLPKLNFYTSKTGDEITIDWQLKYRQSNPNNKKLASSNGYGFSTDLLYQYKYDNTSNNNYIRIEINDLGYISWSKQSSTIYSSDSISYQGYYIKNITEINDSILQNTTLDSLTNNHSYSKTESFITNLPTRLSLSLYQQHHEKTAINIGVNHRINANYKPYFYAEEHFFLTPFITLISKISYGGYSNLSFGVSSLVKWKNGTLFIGTNNVEGIFLTQTVGGFSIFTGLKIQF